MSVTMNRRRLLAGLPAMAAGLNATPALAEPPPEVTRLRLPRIPSICMAPQYVAEELLHAEGFTEVTYVETQAGLPLSMDIASGKIDFGQNYIAAAIAAIDQGHRLTLLGGVHPGCFELFVKPGIESILDLKGRKVGVQSLGSSPHLFLTSMAAYVGLDPVSDIDWVSDPKLKPKELFLRGDVDAFLGFPPEPQELRAQGGRRGAPQQRARPAVVAVFLLHVWAAIPISSPPIRSPPSGCCGRSSRRPNLRVGPRTWWRSTSSRRSSPPTTTTRSRRCRRFRYRQWREFDPEDTVRFYALRLHEAGMIKSSPQKIIADGTDWRFLNELKRELKT